MPDNDDMTQVAPETGGESTNAAPTETPPSGAAPRLFTQEEMNRVAAEAREQGRKSAIRQQPGAPTPPPVAPAPVNAPAPDDGGRVTLKQLQEQLDEEKMRRAFDKRAARRNLTDEQSDDLFELYRVQRPADPDAWFDKKSAVYGFGKPGSGSTTPPAAPPAAATPAATAQPTAQPISDKGAPSPGGVTLWQRELAENPLGMSAAAVNAMTAELGADAARKKLVEAGLRQAERIRLWVKPQR